MEISTLIDQLEYVLQHSVRVPASGRLLVDETTVREIIAQMRLAMPDEERFEQEVTDERERILGDARSQARRMIEEAQAHVASRIDDQGVVQAARERARAIIAEAEQRASALHVQADQYSLSQLASLEGRLQRILREVQAGQRFRAQGQAQGEEAKSSLES